MNEIKNIVAEIRISKNLQASLLLKNEDIALAPNPRTQKNIILAKQAPQPNANNSSSLY